MGCRRSWKLGVALGICLTWVTGGIVQTSGGTGGKIAFVSTQEPYLQIYVMNADGSNVTRVSNPPGLSTSPAFSPGGREIAYVYFLHPASPQVHIMNSDGSNIRALTNFPPPDWKQNPSPRRHLTSPAFSPDGRRIVFSLLADKPPRDEVPSAIYIMNVDGSDLHPLTDGAEDTSPAFSPDGNKIVFASERNRNTQIYLMSTDGSNVTKLTNSPESNFAPVFTRNGRIVFVSRRNNSTQIYVMNADGSNEVRLTNPPGLNYSPSVSPDGSKIAFVRDGGGITITTIGRDGKATTTTIGKPGVQIYMMDADGSNVTPLTNLPGRNTDPSFGP